MAQIFSEHQSKKNAIFNTLKFWLPRVHSSLFQVSHIVLIIVLITAPGPISSQNIVHSMTEVVLARRFSRLWSNLE